MIKKCNCVSKFQDEKYGEGMRVMNETQEMNPITYRCTVCGKERT